MTVELNIRTLTTYWVVLNVVDGRDRELVKDLRDRRG
jgi:hypothetical protein